MRALTIAILLAAVVPASADSPPPKQQLADPPKPPGAKSERTAMWLSGGGIAVSSGFILASFLVNLDDFEPYLPPLYIGVGTSIITPSLGQLYAGQYLTIGMGIRGIAAAAALLGASWKQDQPCVSDATANCPGVTGGGLTIVSLAAIAYVGGIAYDVRDSPHAVRRYNKRLAAKRGAALAPTRNGVAVVGYF